MGTVSLLFLLIVVLASGSFIECAKPNILFILADDYGFNDIGYHQSQGETTAQLIYTPNLDALAQEGVRLESHYAQPLCSPTRGALMTGRLPAHTGIGPNVIKPDMPYAMPKSEQFLAEVLRDAGYATHLVGKWHMGFCDERYTPTFRGFQSFFGYFNGAEDYYTHMRTEDGYIGFDLRDGTTPNELAPVAEANNRYKNMYSTEVFGARVVSIIQDHAEQSGSVPLFMYIPFQAVHNPLEVPAKYTSPYGDIKNNDRKTEAGMINAMDQAVGNITSALKSTGLWQNSIIIFVADNGGPEGNAANNYPLRGYKTTNFEGGVRVNAFMAGPGANISSSLIGKQTNQLFHIVDWLPTLAHAAGATLNPPNPLDGFDQWDSITTGSAGPRNFIVHNMPPLAKGLTHGALRYNQWKFIIQSSHAGSKAEANTTCLPPPGFTPAVTDVPPVAYKGYYLFNINDDPYETTNLAQEEPDQLQFMIDMFKTYQTDAVDDLSTKYEIDPTCDPQLNSDKAWAPWDTVPGSQCSYL
ncbi:arylsulfatase B [Pelomyxa schiedti]|nr:arylsulfatase B [Pelomyxa schiedti]